MRNKATASPSTCTSTTVGHDEGYFRRPKGGEQELQETPRGMRTHIGLFGRRNAGKSSLINALTGQDAALVSPFPGTTTDPVWKTMELLPFGPVVFIDTAGLDDEGELGRMRVRRTQGVLGRTDLALLVVDATVGWTPLEEDFAAELKRRQVKHLVVWNKADLAPDKIPAGALAVSAADGRGIEELKAAIMAAAPPSAWEEVPLIADLISPGGLVLLVVPLDREAPRGRLILPQVQTLRAILEAGGQAMVTTDTGLPAAWAALACPPALVITDSQAFARVAGFVPREVPLTSFSILFARYKGDLASFVHGAAAIDALKDGDRILIAEACTHHVITDDIARVKLPRWLGEYTGRKLAFSYAQGNDFPTDLSLYRLVIQCGGCMVNRAEVLARIARAQAAGVPITNYGVAIAKLHGILERALAPFKLLPRSEARGLASPGERSV
ncbi:MAG: [FeFe] hydrogenase H-cluster maturation GTPase HydF [Firmicutes bacterium]|nr:[FeFe] hydrogenase H-cluster maturation GTPase HydF [Bacillota bacterium]